MDVMVLVIMFAALALLGIASLAWGVDSRPGFSDPSQIDRAGIL